MRAASNRRQEIHLMVAVLLAVIAKAKYHRHGIVHYLGHRLFSTIGNTNVAAPLTPYRLQRPGPLMNDSLIAKVRSIGVCVCVCACARACVQLGLCIFKRSLLSR